MIHAFVIYLNPQGSRRRETAWRNYAAKQDDLTHRDGRWFTDSDVHAARARRYGLLVADCSLEAIA